MTVWLLIILASIGLFCVTYRVGEWIARRMAESQRRRRWQWPGGRVDERGERSSDG